MNLIKPKKLKPGDTIAIIAPSGVVDIDAINKASIYFTNKGYKIKLGENISKTDRYLAGNDVDRLSDLHSAFEDNSIDAIICARGGYGALRLANKLDFELIKKHPKIIIGFSDVTALLLAIYAKTGLVTFYGPDIASSFGELPPFVDWTFESFNSFVNGISVPYNYEMPIAWTDEFIDWSKQDRAKNQYSNQWVCVKQGTCQGRLIGGNLNTMEGFFGTEYMPVINKGDILFIEDAEKDAYTIERSFSLLKLAGVFDKVSGIILGKHEKFDDNGTGRKPYEILLEVIGDTSIPILAEFDCCHTHPMLTMPIGCEVLLDATNKKVVLMEEPLN